ncbi:MAG: alpha/beta hydrolase [Clostridia bacterium]|nr:alpha/beta hydrolase [Clostridia bacterium]
MDGTRIMPEAEVAAMFARLSEVKLDISGIKRKFLDCPYGEDPRQTLDIYLPDEGDGPFPTVFFVHGGRWSGGDKRDSQIVQFVEGVRRGFAVVGVGYRLIPRVRYPDNLFDVKSALSWIAENAGNYLIDRDRTALGGASAGAHLAMMAAFTMGQAAFEPTPGRETCRVLAVVDEFGPTDFSKIRAHFDESGYPHAASADSEEPADIELLFGVPAISVPNLLRFVNPIDSVHPGVPPILVQHGRYDPLIPYQQSVRLVEKINALAGDGHAELDLSETFLHADPGYAGQRSIDTIWGFLDEYLK